MSSNQIKEVEDNWDRLALVEADSEMELVFPNDSNAETESDSDNDQQNLSSLDANQSVQCKNVKNSSVNDVTVATKRLQRDLEQLSLSSPTDISANMKEDNLFEWEASIRGPPGTPYEGGTFILDLIFPANFPYRPPKVIFKTKIYNCNINSDGRISLNILRNEWNPVMTIEKVLLSIQSFFTDCDPDDCLVPEIAAQYVNNREEHDRVCREWTKKYATEEA